LGYGGFLGTLRGGELALSLLAEQVDQVSLNLVKLQAELRQLDFLARQRELQLCHGRLLSLRRDSGFVLREQRGGQHSAGQQDRNKNHSPHITLRSIEAVR
jgi:hypothetical protein